jgi:hypothetical protein
MPGLEKIKNNVKDARRKAGGRYNRKGNGDDTPWGDRPPLQR